MDIVADGALSIELTAYRVFGAHSLCGRANGSRLDDRPAKIVRQAGLTEPVKASRPAELVEDAAPVQPILPLRRVIPSQREQLDRCGHFPAGSGELAAHGLLLTPCRANWGMNMTGRTDILQRVVLLAAWGCSWATASIAQEWPGGPTAGSPPMQAGYGMPPGEGMGLGYGPPMYGESGGYCPPGGYVSPAGYNGPPAENEWDDWGMMQPLFGLPLSPPPASFVRMEYLNWDIQGPGTDGLGAPSLITNPDRGFNFDTGFPQRTPGSISQDPTTGQILFDPTLNSQLGNVQLPFYLPTTRDLQNSMNNGVRGTLGVPLEDYATLEFDGFYVEKNEDRQDFRTDIFTSAQPTNNGSVVIDSPGGLANLPILSDPSSAVVVVPGGLAVFPARPVTTVLVDGQVTDRFIAYNTAFSVDYATELYGAGAKYLFNAVAPPGEGFKLQPFVGFRYVGFREALSQNGQINTGTTIRNTNITSQTQNQLLGGQFGLRTELQHRWFTIGVQPAVTFAGNVGKATVSTNQLVSAADTFNSDSANYTQFSPIFELGAYGRLNLGNSLRLTAGYDAMYLFQTLRAPEVIRYNTTTDATGALSRSAFTAERSFSGVGVSGFSVGAELVF